MFSRIVVPLDGSPLSERAIPVAREIAGRAGGTLRLVRVHVPPRIPATAPHVLGPRVTEELKRQRAQARERDEEYLQEAGDDTGDGPTPEFSTALLRGPAGHSVIDECRRSEASLVVVSAPVPGHDEPDGLDKVTDTVVRGCPTPVLVVKERAEAGGEAGIGRILLPLDGSHRSEAVLPAVEELARLFEAPVTIMRVVREDDRDDRKEGEARRYLDALSDELRTRAVRVDTLLAYDAPAERILHAVAERDVDLIAMTSRCRGPLTRLMLGSVAAEVLRRADVSVLVAHPGD